MSKEPLILAVETTGDICGVAVARGPLLLCECSFSHRMHLSERLIELVDTVLRNADSRIEDVEVYAAGIGPGSYTGARVGVMTAKALAEVVHKPLVGIGALEAMAAAWLGLPETTIVPLLPCRADLVYAAEFSVDRSAPLPLTEPDVLSAADLADRLSRIGRSALACGPGVERRRDLFSSRGIAIGDAAGPRAAIVCRLAWDRIRLGAELENPLSVNPLYMAPPQITLPRDRRGLPPSAVPGNGE